MFKWFKDNFFPDRAGEIKIVKEPKKNLYAIDVLSTHRCRFVVECNETQLENIISDDKNIDDLTEFSQEHLGDRIVSYYPLNDENHYLKVFDDENSYLSSWNKDLKLSLINRK